MTRGRGWLRGIAGHYWTLAPFARHHARLGPAQPSSWSLTLADARFGGVRLTGVAQGKGSTAFLLIHGLGGSPASHYLLDAERALRERGLASLRLAQRGADRLGEDLHHAGLYQDLVQVIERGFPASVRDVCVLGFSMGGHVALRLAAAAVPRLGAVAAVCTPLELDPAVHYVDTHIPAYRRYLLHGLIQVYAAIGARRRHWSPLPEVRAARSLREWDSLTVVPRFGFADAETYYHTQSARHVLSALRVPALLLYASDDPIIRPDSIEPALRGSATCSNLSVLRVRGGGHVGFPAGLDLGFGARKGLSHQLITWCLQHSEAQALDAERSADGNTAAHDLVEGP
jgi:predicted alpha/beta-fold hydrolase